MIFLEILVILVVVALQLRVYLQNKQRAAALASFFPQKKQLFMQAAGKTASHISSSPQQAIRAGKPYQLSEDPGKVFSVRNRDGAYYVVAVQGGPNAEATFLLTEEELEDLPQKAGFSFFSPPQEQDATAPIMVPAAQDPSQGFEELLEELQEYLQRSKGAVSGLESIREMSERRLEDEVQNLQATVSSPLYIGLLGTFLGVILGLGSVVLSGVTEEGISEFLLGVVVAMAGSFGGLLFTLLGNLDFRRARKQASLRLSDWLGFLQTHLLPSLQSDLSQSLGNLKVVLDEFNQDFFRRITDFKDVFANLNQYVGLQERFLTSLQQSDFNKLTEANLRFFEQIQKNESLFERFGQYLQSLNESMDNGRQATADIREVVSKLRQLDDVQAYLRQNEELIRKQLGYLNAHHDKMEAITHGIQQHFIEAGDDMGKLVRRRLQILQKEEQDAGEQLRQHFERLKEENVYQKIAEQLQPIRQMETDVQDMRELFADTLKHLLETQQYLIRKINQDGQTQGRLLKEMESLNNHMQQLSERKSWLQRMFGGR